MGLCGTGFTVYRVPVYNPNIHIYFYIFLKTFPHVKGQLIMGESTGRWKYIKGFFDLYKI